VGRRGNVCVIKTIGFVGRMKAKNIRKGTDKKAYIGPRVTVLLPESDEGKKVADAMGSKSSGKGQDILGNRKAKSSKAGKP